MSIDQGMDKWQIFLHPSQRKLVDAEYKGTMKVSGGAGTGKTIAAIHRLKYLCQKPGQEIRPRAEIVLYHLCVCYRCDGDSVYIG